MKNLKILVFLLPLLFGFCYAAQAQNDKFNKEDAFMVDLQTVLGRSGNAATRKVAQDFEATFQALPAETKTKVFEIVQSSYKHGVPPSPHIESFLEVLHAGINIKKLSADQLNKLLDITKNMLKDYNFRRDVILPYFIGMKNFLAEDFIYKTKFNQYKISPNATFTFDYIKPINDLELKNFIKNDSTAIDKFNKQAQDSTNQIEEDFGWGTEAPKEETDPFKVQEVKSDDNGGWDTSNPWGDAASDGTDTTQVAEKPTNFVDDFVPTGCSTPQNDTTLVDGAFIRFEKMNLQAASGYDTISISNVSGIYLPIKNMFNAHGGTVTWKKLGLSEKDVYCELSTYSINLKLPAFSDNTAKMSYKTKTDSVITGIFEYKAAKNNSKPFAQFPKFMSYKANIDVKNIAKDMNFKGGFSLIGKRFSSLNYCNEPSQVEVYKNGKLKIRAVSRQEYLFGDSLFQNNQAAITVFMTDTATISHPGVKLKYMFSSGDLTARKEKFEYRYTPFYDSYHKVEIQADFLKWNIAADTMSLSILNAKKQIPAEIRSMDFYNGAEMHELQRLQKFHPLLILSGYLMREPKNAKDKELRTKERLSMSMYLQDVAVYNKVSLKSLQGVMMDIHRLGLVEYDSRREKFDEKTGEVYYGWVKLLRKGKHFIDAHNKKEDYDKVWLKSFMPNGKNMKVDLTSNELTLSGVPFFYLKKIDGDQREERTELVEQKSQKLMQDSLSKMPQEAQDTISAVGKDIIAEVFRQIERRKIDLMDVSVWDTLKVVNPDAIAAANAVPKEVIAEIVVRDPMLDLLKGKEKKDYIQKLENDKKKKALAKEKALAKVDSIAKSKPKVQDLRKIKSKQVIIKENREMEFNAHPLVAENYGRFYGKSFTFNYKDYFVRMPATDSLIFEGADNGIKVTSGTFYLGHPKNKSSNRSVPEYPKFEAEVGGYIDFKSAKILDGAYDSLVKFELEPFTLDSMASTDPENENLMGMFESNGIFPNFRDTIKLGKFEDVSLDPKEAAKNKKNKKSRSFGFTHFQDENKTYKQGYPLYRKNNAFFNGNINLQGNNGIRGDGEITYLTAKLYSNDFIYYEDSVVTFGKKSSQRVVSNGTIKDTLSTYAGEGLAGSTSYPDVRMKWFGMQWVFERDKNDDTKIVRDSMLLKSNEGIPFEMYHRHPNPEQKGSYQGTLSLTDRALRGSGQFDNKNSVAVSKEFLFENKRYNAGHTFFAIKRAKDNTQTDTKTDPKTNGQFVSRDNAVEATNVRVDYEFDEGISEDEQTGHAVIESEVKGAQSFSFPDAKYKTSLGKADWFFAYKRMTMSMSEGSDLSSSVFSSTHLAPKENISFNGSNAIYDLDAYKLTVSGVPYIYSMNARIIPYNGDINIEKGAKMDPLKDAIVELLSNKDENDTVCHHRLYNSSIVVHSRNKFTGSGTHKYENDAKEQFNILFNNFEARGRSKEDDSIKIVYAKTKIVEKDKFMKQAGVQFRGDVILRADSVNLLFEGEIKFVDEPNSTWFPLGSSGGAIAVSGVEEVDGKEYGTGLFMSDDTKSVRTIFKSEIERGEKPIFKAEGVFRKDVATGELVIEPFERQRPDLHKAHFKYTGNNFVYSSKIGKAHFDGEFDLIRKGEGFTFRTIGIGNSEFAKKKYEINMMVALTIPEIKGNAFKKMGDDVAKFIKNTAPSRLPRANDSTFYKISHLVTPDKLEDYIKDASRGKEEYSDYLENSLILTHVNLHWSESQKAFYSKGKIGLGNIFKEETNIWVDGFVEIPFDPQNPKNQHINIYLELSKNKWYYFTQRGNDLKMIASDVFPSEGTNDYGNPEFNTEVGNSKSKDKFKIADVTEKARFKSSFRQNYLGDSSPEPEPEKPKDEDKTIEDEKKVDDNEGDGKTDENGEPTTEGDEEKKDDKKDDKKKDKKKKKGGK